MTQKYQKSKWSEWPDCKICGYKNMVYQQFPYELCGTCSFEFLDYMTKIPQYIPETQMEMWYIEKFKRI